MKISDSLQLPCGVELSSRLAKAALNENIGEADGRPGKRMKTLYEMWANCGAALNISGNVMVDARGMVEEHNVVLENDSYLDDVREWARIAQSGGTQFWMQINHPGRQAQTNHNKEIVGPSAVKLQQKGHFGLPRALEEREILELIRRYGNTARLAKEAGFSGVQIHGAHGYLVSQFLSPKTNIRSDRWGGKLENRARFLLEIFRTIREQVGPHFPIGVKINSADFQRGGFDNEDSLNVIRMLEAEGIDLIEVSGGTYEKAAMMGVGQRESTRKREAYFLEFAQKVKAEMNVPLMLTGGFRTLAAMEEALSEKACDLIGMGRPFSAYPKVAAEFLDGTRQECVLPNTSTGIKTLDKMGAVDLTWHSMQLRLMAEGKMPNMQLSPWWSVWDLVKRLYL